MYAMQSGAPPRGAGWLFLLALVCGAQADVRFTITDIGVLPGADYSVAQGLASNGFVAGDGGASGFFWCDGLLTAVGTFGGSWSNALDVNAGGQVVGWAHLPGNRSLHAFVWQQGAMIDLGTLGGTSSGARAINDAGQIVGWAELSGALDQRACLWQNGQVTDLGTLGGGYSVAYDINAAGRVVGQAARATGPSHAFLFVDGVMQDLAPLADEYSVAFGLNDADQVVGRAWPAGGEPRAFLWDDGVMTDLGSLDGRYTTAQAINNGGQVVGYSEVLVQHLPGEPELEFHSFIWESGTLLDLNDLIAPQSGWRLFEAFGINDGGQIVGMGEINGAIHGFLLTPVPEPATLALLLAIASLLPRGRR